MGCALRDSACRAIRESAYFVFVFIAGGKTQPEQQLENKIGKHDLDLNEEQLEKNRKRKMRFMIFPLIVFYAFGLCSLASGRTIRLKKFFEGEVNFNLQKYEYYNQTQQKFRQYNTTMKQIAQFVAQRNNLPENRVMFYYYQGYPSTNTLTAFPRTQRLHNGTYVYGSTEGEHGSTDPFLLNYGNQLFNNSMIGRTIGTNENGILWWCDTNDCLKEKGRIVKRWYPKIGEAENYPDSGPEADNVLSPVPPMCRSFKQDATWSDHQYCEERGCTDTYTHNGETFPCYDQNDPYSCVMGGAHDHFTPGTPQPQRCPPRDRKCVSSDATTSDAWCQEVECDLVYVDAGLCKWVDA